MTEPNSKTEARCGKCGKKKRSNVLSELCHGNCQPKGIQAVSIRPEGEDDIQPKQPPTVKERFEALVDSSWNHDSYYIKACLWDFIEEEIRLAEKRGAKNAIDLMTSEPKKEHHGKPMVQVDEYTWKCAEEGCDRFLSQG